METYSKNGLSKRCSSCHMWNRLDGGYYKDASRPDGLKAKCKKCERRAKQIYAKRKKCARCKVTKDKSEFSLCRSRTDGLQPYCKSCSRSIAKAYQERLECVECGQMYSKKANPDPLHCKDCKARRADEQPS